MLTGPAADDFRAALELVAAEAGDNAPLNEALVRLRSVSKHLPVQQDDELNIIDQGADDRMMQQVLRRFEDDVLIRQEISLWLTDLLADRHMLEMIQDEPLAACFCTCEACLDYEGANAADDDIDDFEQPEDVGGEQPCTTRR